MAAALGDELWPDWEKTPFAVLLVTSEHEFLIRHPRPSDDFLLIGDDEELDSKVWYRKRTFSPDLEAAFPAVGGVSTVVIGQADSSATGASTRWLLTLIHEHFHQLQHAQPDYYAGVQALGLDGGDKTGMWMLEYPFPYDDEEVGERFAVMCEALATAVGAKEHSEFDGALAAYATARSSFLSALSAEDAKYFDFQTWQEGVARYTEYEMARLAATRYHPSQAFEDLAGFTPFELEAVRLRRSIERSLLTAQLSEAKRIAFYAVGAAEGLVLDAAHPLWRHEYFAQSLSLGTFFDAQHDHD